MDPQLLILLAGGAWALAASAIVFFGFRQMVGRVDSAHQVVADSAGLTETQSSRVGSLNPSSRLRARSGPLDVEIVTNFVAKREAGPTTVIAIAGLADISLTSEGVRSSVSRSLGGLEIHVGDPAFDDNLFVRGLEPLVRAVLDAETRRLVLLLFQGRVEILGPDTDRVFDGTVSLDSGLLRVKAVNAISSPKWLGECLLGFLDVARRMAQPADIPGRLAANARDDPLPEVRLANLRALAEEYPGRPVTRRTLRWALAEPDLDVRSWAARQLREEGRPVLLEIAANPQLSEEAQAGAVWALGDLLPTEVGLKVLSQALRSRRLPVVEACLGALAQKGGTGVVPSLSKVLAVERGWLAVAAARALGDSGEGSAERALLTALGRNDEGVGVAAAKALGRVGTASAVLRLRGVESSSGDDALRRAAREAVAEIQSRLTGATPGQLSLASGETGQLSLAQDESGRVALHDEGAAEVPNGSSSPGPALDRE